MTHAQLNDLLAEPGPSGAGRPILPGMRFRTPWLAFDGVRLESGEAFGPSPADGSEEGYLVLQGRIQVGTEAEAERQMAEVAVARCSGADGLRAYNSGDSPALFIFVRVAVGETGTRSADGVTVETVDRDRLEWRPAIHGGAGRIATRHIWGPGDFDSSWTFLDHAVLAADSSVGYHYHDGLEECFVVLSGSGLMTVNGRTFEVGAGSVTFQGIGEGHGIYNPNQEELDFLRIAVGVPGEEFTSIDLDDDLAEWQPS